MRRIRQIAWKKVALYTYIQLAITTVVFFVSFNLFLPPSSSPPPIAVTFPLFIAALVPLREKGLLKLFSESELELLDPVNKSAKEVVEDEEAYVRTTVVERSSVAAFARTSLIKIDGVRMRKSVAFRESLEVRGLPLVEVRASSGRA